MVGVDYTKGYDCYIWKLTWYPYTLQEDISIDDTISAMVEHLANVSFPSFLV